MITPTHRISIKKGRQPHVVDAVFLRKSSAGQNVFITYPSPGKSVIRYFDEGSDRVEKIKFNPRKRMEKYKFKEGDYAYCNFDVVQIKEMHGDTVVGVSDGLIVSRGDYTAYTFPIDMKVKICSDLVKKWQDRLLQHVSIGLNYPELKKELVRIWCEMCRCKDNEELIQELIIELDDFGRRIENAIDKAKSLEVFGIKVFTYGLKES